MIPSYSKIYAIGHKAVLDIFHEEVVVQEKVDGSQFSFRYTESDGVICFSKNTVLVEGNIPNLFQPAFAWVQANQDKLALNHIYRAEAICRPKHNVLKYDNPPPCGFVLFDVDQGICDYLLPDELQWVGRYLGVPVVPTLFQGHITDPAQLLDLMNLNSFLGGTKVEGIVVKNYTRFGLDSKVIMAKYVSEHFKEKHAKDPQWMKKPDYLERLIEQYRTEARWRKAVQHLEESGYLLQDPKDIGKIMAEVKRDVVDECIDEIKEQLWERFHKQILSGIVKGIPEWYKQLLVDKCFKE